MKRIRRRNYDKKTYTNIYRTTVDNSRVVYLEGALIMNKICPLTLISDKPLNCYKENCMYWVADIEGNRFCMYVDRFFCEYMLGKNELNERYADKKLTEGIIQKPSEYSYG